MFVFSSISSSEQSSESAYWAISAVGGMAVASAIVNSLVSVFDLEPSDTVNSMIFVPDES